MWNEESTLLSLDINIDIELDDLESLFQPGWFCDSVIKKKKQQQTIKYRKRILVNEVSISSD